MKALRAIIVSLVVCGTLFSAKVPEIGYFGNRLEVDAVGRIAKSETITADLQIVGVRKVAHVKLTSDFAVASDATIRLSKGETRGQALQLTLISTNPVEMLDDQGVPTAGNIKLSGDWLPGQWDTINLTWTGNHWLEDSRSDN